MAPDAHGAHQPLRYGICVAVPVLILKLIRKPETLMNQGSNRGSGSDDRFGSYGAERDDRNESNERDDERRTQNPRQRQQEAYSGGDWLTHRQQGGSDWQGRGGSQQGGGSDWQSSGQQPGGTRWSGSQESSAQGSSSSSVSASSGYGGYEGQPRRYDEGYGEGRYGQYGEGNQGGQRRQSSGREFGRDSGEAGERYQPRQHAERERWGNWHQEGEEGRGSEWSSQQGSQRDEWGQGRAVWDQPARSGTSSRQSAWDRGHELGREMGRELQPRGRGRESWGGGFEGSTGSEPDMRTHYRGGYGMSDYDASEPSARQSDQGWQRHAASDWLDEHERRERLGQRLAGYGGSAGRGGQGGQGDYDPNQRAYEHFTGASERNDLNRGYGGAGGSAAARRAQRSGPKGYQRSDERIREDLCERLAMSGRLDVREVEVTVSGGVVTLSGTVQDRQQKYRIEDMADEVFGVKDVQNQIRVTRESGQGGTGMSGRSGMSGSSQSLGSQAGTTSSSASGSTGSLGSGSTSSLGASGTSSLGGSTGSSSSTTPGKSGV